MKPAITTAFVGVGSNIDPAANIQAALRELKRYVAIEGVSTFYRTKPVGGPAQEDYLNGVWRIATDIEPTSLKFEVLKTIERQLHREPSLDKYAPRTIDLDLLLFGDRVMDDRGVRLPDSDIYTRPFIAIPLAELAPGLRLPGTGTLVREIAERMDGVSMIPDQLLTEQLRRELI